MKGIIKGRKKRKFNGHTFYYFSIVGRKEHTIEIEELKALSETLPVECQKIVRKINLFHVPMMPEEQEKMLLLCSLSIYCWNGGPKCSLPGISMEDYTNDFYIEMSGALLRSWDSSKGPWPAYVKFVRLKTVANSIKRWERIKSGMEVENFHALDKNDVACEGWDMRSMKRGTPLTRGRRITNTSRF